MPGFCETLRRGLSHGNLMYSKMKRHILTQLAHCGHLAANVLHVPHTAQGATASHTTQGCEHGRSLTSNATLHRAARQWDVECITPIRAHPARRGGAHAPATAQRTEQNTQSERLRRSAAAWSCPRRPGGRPSSRPRRAAVGFPVPRRRPPAAARRAPPRPPPAPRRPRAAAAISRSACRDKSVGLSRETRRSIFLALMRAVVPPPQPLWRPPPMPWCAHLLGLHADTEACQKRPPRHPQKFHLGFRV